ncbi:hypothetical protein BDW59DRAFT_158115 [Aspergillus cavernicola]|uniref:Uncharacterized protein n=1 Tax=Aspergillus cavernicola TaxID=176166 RepID=A0ABR4ITU8_9EURO
MDPTPPAFRNGFEYYKHDFYVVNPPYQRHRRCSVSELRDLFSSSGSKGTAVMRFMDALRRAELEVPEHLKKLERVLKREWEKSASARYKQNKGIFPEKKSIDRRSSGFGESAFNRKRKRDLDHDFRAIGSEFAVAASAPSSEHNRTSVSNSGRKVQSAKRRKEEDTLRNVAPKVENWRGTVKKNERLYFTPQADTIPRPPKRILQDRRAENRHPQLWNDSVFGENQHMRGIPTGRHGRDLLYERAP